MMSIRNTTVCICLGLSPRYVFVMKLVHRMGWTRLERFLEKHPRFVWGKYRYAVRFFQRKNGEWDFSLASAPRNESIDPRWPDAPNEAEAS
jgi:hypothetical protein